LKSAVKPLSPPFGGGMSCPVVGRCSERTAEQVPIENTTMNRALRSLVCEPPFRLLFKAALTNGIARRYAFEWAALFDAVRYPPYAVGLQTACKYASLAGETGFTAIEFGVAGGNGLLELSRYAATLSRGTGLKIEVVGFDAISGLPVSPDRRDAPWLWNPGDFPSDVVRLRRMLPPETELVVGRIQDTLPKWLQEESRLPIGFVSVDVDLYSGAAAICEGMANANVKCLLPFVSFYLDDALRFLTPRVTGELAAVSEFNGRYSDRQFDRDDWIAEDRPFAERLWLKRMYSLCNFDHPVMTDHKSRRVARLDLCAKNQQCKV
jgi:hypothetical protein